MPERNAFGTFFVDNSHNARVRVFSFHNCYVDCRALGQYTRMNSEGAMKRFITLIFLLLFGVAESRAQEIVLERFDALPGKSHFITATQPFSMLISLDNVSSCTGVSFELRFNNAGSIYFDGWTAVGAFPSNGIVIIDESNRVSGQGKITVGALSLQGTSGITFDDPVIVQLNFVVNTTAQHNTNTVFSFVNAEAVVAQPEGTIVNLFGQPQLFNVHGYVDVWPGDANNDGIVNNKDISQIGLFFDDGDPNGRIRGFKRTPQSTNWAPQSALAWDSVRVTYTDCDGSGRVDINDLLVVWANMSKTHTVVKGGDPIATPTTPHEDPEPVVGTIQVPVRVNTGYQGIGVSGRIDWSKCADRYNVVGVSKGELFAGAPGFFSVPGGEGTNYIDVALGYFYPSPDILLNGEIFVLSVEPLQGGNGSDFEFDFINQSGIHSGGGIFNLSEDPIGSVLPESITGVRVFPTPTMEVMTISNERVDVTEAILIDALGREVLRFDVILGANEVHVGHLVRGGYTLVLSGKEVMAAMPVLLQ